MPALHQQMRNTVYRSVGRLISNVIPSLHEGEMKKTKR